MIETIQNKITLNVKRLFHHLGFIIEKVPDINTLFFELHNSHEAVQRHVLKRVTDNIRIANNHKLYNKLLKRYIPNWNDNLTSAEFIGNGVGEYSFNTFRKVYFENKCYFEKIYFNDTYDLSRVVWFFDHVYPMLHSTLSVAKLGRVVKGHLITIVYFEFLDLVPLSNGTAHSVSSAISKKLIKISSEDCVKKLIESAPDYLKNYKLHAYYRGNINLATRLMSDLSSGGLSPMIIENAINLQPLVLTHGDIQKTNLFANNFLIDWDSFGFFPLGLESAYILCKSDFHLQRSITITDLQKVLRDTYQVVIDKDQWIDFQLSVFYFYFIFIALDNGTLLNVTLQKDIFERVKHLYMDVDRRNRSKKDNSV